MKAAFGEDQNVTHISPGAQTKMSEANLRPDNLKYDGYKNLLFLVLGIIYRYAN